MDTLNIDLRLQRIQAQWTDADRAARQNEGQRRLREFFQKFVKAEQEKTFDMEVRGQRFDLHPC